MNNKIVNIILLCIALAIIPVYWLRFAFTNAVIRDSLYLSSVIAAVIGGGYALSKYGLKQARGLTLILLTTGVLFLLIGELIFEYYYIVLKHDIPFPSIADIFYLSSYPLLLAGFFNEIRLADVHFRKLNKMIWVLLIAIALGLSYVVYQWGIVTGYDPKEQLFTNIIAMSYGVGDIFLIMTALFLSILVREYRGGKFAGIWIYMMAGFCLLLTGDIFAEFFREQYHNEVWFWKSFLDTLGMLGYLCYAKALFNFGFSIVDAYNKILGLKDKSADAHQIVLTTTSNESSKAPLE